jgi:hypothetical protein
MRLERKLAAPIAAAVLALSPAASRAQSPAPQAAPERVRLVLNAAFWPTKTSFSDSQSFTEYAEKTTIQTSYEAGTGFGPDAAVQVSLFGGVGLLVGYSHASRDETATVNVSRPHPLYLNQPRTASAEATGYSLSEDAVHLDVAYARAAGRLDWSLFGGVTLFQVDVDLLAKPTYTDVYPYDELVIASTPSTAVKESPTGFNVGGRLDYRFGSSRRFGAGVQVMYSKATAKARANADATEASFDAGGLSLAGGLRLYF